MAVQEKYVHLPKPVPAALKFVMFRIEFNEVAVTRLLLTDLPAGWQLSPPTTQTQVIGDEWVAKGSSAVLAVPSALIPEEENYLINPAHPDFARISISEPEPFTFNDRLAALIEPRKA